MSPLTKRTLMTADTLLPAPFIDMGNGRAAVRLAAGAFTVNTIDAQGYLKAGTPLTRAGILPGVAPAFVYGSVVEPVKVADGNSAPQVAAAIVQTVGVTLDAVVNLAALEDVLGRALTADELAAYDRAGSQTTLVF